ncbi:MAG: radical SAM protein [Clostridia bacterium]|jgi:DNA repair photolyase|nr:radical SAM protein [Clostridia bacterium]
MEYITAKSVLMVTDSDEWFGSEYNINLYRGCSHGCIYCDSRSDCYAIKHFDTVKAKRNALEILADELSRKRKKGIVSLGSMSDSYNPCEKELELTRGALKLLDRYGFGVTLETKSELVLRDADVLKSISSHSPVIVKFTVTTPYDELAKKLEPKSSSPKKRFAALETLSNAGLFTGVLMTPILPFIEDDSASVISLVDRAASAGCKFAYAGRAFGVTMRDSQRAHFLDKAEKLFPGMKARYLDAFGDDYFCISPRSGELMKTFTERCLQKGLLYTMDSIVAESKRPYETRQISLFDF